MKIIAHSLIAVVCFISANALCYFPCDWVGKIFYYDDPTRPDIVGNFTFDENNMSEAIIVTPNGPAKLVCESITGSHIVMQWTEATTKRSCMTAVLLSPDAFVFLGRHDIDKTEFCDLCYSASNDETSFRLIARANGATDDFVRLTCRGPEQCEPKRHACDYLPDLIPCDLRRQKKGKYYGRRY